MEAGESTVVQSDVLSEGEVNNIVEGAEPEEALLASDKVEFEVPEKFQGKSIEDVIKSYQELEKFKSTPEVEEVEGEEVEYTEIQQESYDKYASSLDTNGSLSEAEYAELAAQGYDKATVDEEIAARSDEMEFNQYKSDKALNEVIAPLGGGTEKFQEVSAWANQHYSEAEVAEFNQALASVPKSAQVSMLKGLYAEYATSGEAVDTVLHTNTPQRQAGKGYNTQEEFFKDIGSEEYKNNAAYRSAVEAKMAKSSIF